MLKVNTEDLTLSLVVPSILASPNVVVTQHPIVGVKQRKLYVIEALEALK